MKKLLAMTALAAGALAMTACGSMFKLENKNPRADFKPSNLASYCSFELPLGMEKGLTLDKLEDGYVYEDVMFRIEEYDADENLMEDENYKNIIFNNEIQIDSLSTTAEYGDQSAALSTASWKDENGKEYRGHVKVVIQDGQGAAMFAGTTSTEKDVDLFTTYAVQSLKLK